VQVAAGCSLEALDAGELEDVLAPTELAAFERAVVAGQLAGLVPSWQPWWLLPDAWGLVLSREGQPLVSELAEHAPSPPPAAPFSSQPADRTAAAVPAGACSRDGHDVVGAKSRGQKSDMASRSRSTPRSNAQDAASSSCADVSSTRMPGGPSRPLRPLSELTKATPSPLLRWQASVDGGANMMMPWEPGVVWDAHLSWCCYLK
jgi:hypothetical protein